MSARLLVLLALLCSSAANAAENPIDRWAAAVGGREKVAAVKAVYREATIEVAGQVGSIKAWHTPEGRYRKEEKVGTYSTIETFDGKTGLVQQGDGEAHAMAGAELARAISSAFANWNSTFFVFFPERRHGTVTVEDDGTIVMKPEGGIDWRVTLDPRTSLPKTMVHEQIGRTVTVTFVSYETIDGLTIEKEISRTTGDARFDSVIRFTKTIFNPPMDPSLFTIATKTPPAK